MLETAFAVVELNVNGQAVTVQAPPMRRLSDVLRNDLGLTGTKVGCNAGDCGACTVSIDGEPVCACMVPVGRLGGAQILTVEGLKEDPAYRRLQQAFHHYGAAQCGICTPGMLISAAALLTETPTPSEAETLDAIGGVLCRCTGYRKIVEAVMNTHRFETTTAAPDAGFAVGARASRVDGEVRVDGTAIFGADEAPDESLWLKVVRSPHPRARFTLGDLHSLKETYLGIVRVFTAADVPGTNRFGVIPVAKDQPVFAEGAVRYRGEAVAAVVGDHATIEAFEDSDFPISWEVLPAVDTLDEAAAEGAPRLHEKNPGNVLLDGIVERGDLDDAFAGAAVSAEGTFETAFVEHAYIELEAGFARRIGDGIEIQACTQAPYMDRDDVAAILGLEQEQVRVIPTAVGGGFGGKLDLSLQPYIALAAWTLDQPVRCVYTRTESMASTTKRHPARITARVAAKADGTLLAIDFFGAFNTGAYASWGPTVANRVPVHASGPYFYPALRLRSRAMYTDNPPSGAFRGFGVPQSAIAQEGLFDEIADSLGHDRLQFRVTNALRAGQQTATGQVLETSVGMAACLDALRPAWERALADADAFNRDNGGSVRRGVGVANVWYGCGNTSLPNPSTMRAALKGDGTLVLFQGAVDIGQGADTVMTQICADAVGVGMELFTLVPADTDLTADAGKTSASRQTFVSGRAAQLAGEALRANILRTANAGPDALIEIDDGMMRVIEGEVVHEIALSNLAADEDGLVLDGVGTFDPPITPQDAHGQGDPYATFGFGAQVAEVAVDTELGTVKVLRITAAHDVGRAINPTLVEGQVEGGVAQGLGLALMEEYVQGRTENFHDYLIPTAGDMPEVETIIVEDAEPLGPFGAKGIGEHTLIPTAPAILNAIRHATGARVRRVPATPDRVRQAIREAQGARDG